jgi:hypothetical protein
MNPGPGIGTQSVGVCIGGLGKGIGIQSAQERTPTPVPSGDEEGMSYDQERLVRRFRTGGRPSTALGLGATNLKALMG